MKTFRVIACAALVLLWTGAALAQDLPDKVQKRYEALKSFQADFDQELTNAATREVEKRTGVMGFQNPGLVRWETLTPEKQLLVVGKESVWDYIESEGQAIHYRSDQAFTSKTMIRFLSGQANLKEDFKVVMQGQDLELNKVKLIPKEPEPGLVLAYLWVDDEGTVKRVFIVDFYGNGNLVALKNFQQGYKHPADAFSFTPPKGVTILDNTKQ
ncbi:MAG TPA: outer membrane lipoprotein chaperone LolA [Desulfovibrio sp.]|jgi:outer membrane lipoprotein carrier protein|uniref:outer membrane lipoprotein chaperone LolA n=1 Tax=Desulfovibrio TaxID=872 RepID=UPI000425A783|nr:MULTISPECIES: outer membrane lipoprotein chaperone LolA [Desulfovibrio]MDY0305856.1 outer membrane lipoprotein chaperone LolA [Desulfovibrionaceae bacterium]HMM38592.1 outer membrane lipoprotein chaperone LolA [Desulfovibrio sp.]